MPPIASPWWNSQVLWHFLMVSSDHTVGFTIDFDPCSNRLTEKIRHRHWRWRRSRRSRRSSSLPGQVFEPMDPKRSKKYVLKKMVDASRHPCWLNIMTIPGTSSICLNRFAVDNCRFNVEQTLNMPGKRRGGSFLFPINLSAVI